MDWVRGSHQKASSKHDKWRKKEKLSKEQSFTNPDGDDIDNSDSSSEVEDDDAEGVTPQIEKDFLKTLSFVRSRDPRIYDKQSKFYQSVESSSETEESSSTAQEKKDSKEKPVYLRDYERKIILEKGGQYSEDESDGQDNGDSDEERQKREESPTYVEEQKQIRDSFRTALESGESDSEEELLTTKKKSKQEKEEEENDYKMWLKGEGNETAEDKDMGALRNFWTDPNLDEGEKFLRNYILNREYIDKEDHESDSSENNEEEEEAAENDAGFSEEERMLEEQDNFERKFNFRFEEPDADFIKRYPRTVSGSVRKKDTSRAEKRKDRKERKEDEKQHKRDELKRLKNVKKQEILDKLEQLKEATGNAKVGFDPDDLEGDFDPDKHDQMMQNIFNEEYDAEEDTGLKPQFGDEFDEENLGDLEDDEYGGDEDIGGEDFGDEEEYYEPHCEDPDFIMDADYDPSMSKKSTNEKGESSKKKKRKNAGFADAMKMEKPTFDPDGETFDEYMDEYYKLDYEDLIGDLPCRFKYRTVVPNDFGLSVEEVLSAKDKELNQWVSVKKTSQYRTKDEELHDISRFRKRARNVGLKQRIFFSLMEEKSDEDENTDGPQDEAKDTKHDSEEISPQESSSKDSDPLSPRGKKKRKRKLRDGTGIDQDVNVDSGSPKRTVADEQNLQVKGKEDGDTQSVSKKAKKMKKDKLLEVTDLKTDDQDIEEGDANAADNTQEQKKNKRKKKHKIVDMVRESDEHLIKDVATSEEERTDFKNVRDVEQGDTNTAEGDTNTAVNKQERKKNKKRKKKPKTLDMPRETDEVDSSERTVNAQSVVPPEGHRDGVQRSPVKKKRKHSGASSHGFKDRVSTSKVNPLPPSHAGARQKTGAKQKPSKHKKGPMWSSDSNRPAQSKGFSRKIKRRERTGGFHQRQQKNRPIVAVHSKQGQQNSGVAGAGLNKKRRKRRRRRVAHADPVSTISDARLKAYGVNPKKIKYQLEYQKQKQEKNL